MGHPIPSPGPPSPRCRAARRAPLWGAASAALYVAVAGLWAHWGLAPGRLLYDGVAPPPPYQWVRPPRGLARDNRPPEPGTGTVSCRSGRSVSATVTTGDAQATVSLGEGAVQPAAGRIVVRVALTPLDPQTIAPAPQGLQFDGNAYRIEARYEPSGRPAVLRAPVTVVLRYATAGTQVVRASPSGWTALRTIRYPGNLDLLVANTPSLGVFAPAAPRSARYTSHPWGAVAAALAVGLAPPRLVRAGAPRRR